MNRSRYVTRHFDNIDREIIAALTENGRATIKELGEKIGMSGPSVRERILKLEDGGAIKGYTTLVEPKVFGLAVEAFVKLRAIPGELARLAAILQETPQVTEAHRVTGEDCFLVKVAVKDMVELQSVVDRFVPLSSTDTAVVQSSTVTKRLPKI